jgi:hypothetical protein
MSKFTAKVGQDAAHSATNRPINSQCASELRTIGIVHGFSALKWMSSGGMEVEQNADKSGQRGREGAKVGDFMQMSFVHHPIQHSDMLPFTNKQSQRYYIL